MKVSELKLACEEFLLEHGDEEVKLLWEEGALTEGFDPKYYENPTDIRAVADWPLPGKSLVTKNEGAEMSMLFVIMYGEYENIPVMAS
jgi:hypothetical protein